MKCEEFEDYIADYVSGAIDPDVKDQMEAHYFECDECFDALELMDAAVSEIAESGVDKLLEMENDEGTVDWLISEAQKYIDDGDLDVAMLHYKKAQEIIPEDERVKQAIYSLYHDALLDEFDVKPTPDVDRERPVIPDPHVIDGAKRFEFDIKSGTLLFSTDNAGNRQPIQVEGIIFKQTDEGVRYLLLKRTPERGGFWQPVTGGVEGEESVEKAVLREVGEETGISEFIRVIPDVHHFKFEIEGEAIEEHVFGLEVGVDTGVTFDQNVYEEHDDIRWCSHAEAMELLRYDNNKAAVDKLDEIIST